MRTVRLELMRPDEICQVLREKSIAYLPVHWSGTDLRCPMEQMQWQPGNLHGGRQ